MKKTAFLSAAALILSVSTAFAYTNEYAGYSLNNKTPEFVMESSKLYGYIDFKEDAFHSISFFNAAELEAVIGEKFSTEYFNACYTKLAVLDKNDIDKTVLELPLLDLERYTKIDSGNKAILASNIHKQFKENIKPELRVDKLNKKNTITMSLLYKQNNEIINTHITMLSENDMLYMLISAKSLDNSTSPKKDLSPEAILKPKFEPVEAGTLDAKVVNDFWKLHYKYLKGFKVFAPVGKGEPVVAYDDLVAEKRVLLPKDWLYVQYRHVDKQNPGTATLSLPTLTLANIGDKWADDSFSEIGKNEKEDAYLSKLAQEALGEVTNAFLTVSANLDNEPDIVDMLKNPITAKIQLDVLMETGLKKLKEVDSDVLTLNSYKYDTDIDGKRVRADIEADITLFNKYNFNEQLRLLGHPKKGSVALLVNKKGFELEPEIREIYDQWEF